MAIITDYVEVSKKMELIKQLTEEHTKLTDDYFRYNEIHDYKKMNDVGIKKNKIKKQLSELRLSVDYVEFKLFCEVIKTYLTKEQYIEAWDRVKEIASNPEKYLTQLK